MTSSQPSIACSLDRGVPAPLGATFQNNGTNFAVVSRQATDLTLLVYQPGAKKPFLEIPFDVERNRTGDVWHVRVDGLSTGMEYSYRVDGTNGRFDSAAELVDPYAKLVTTPDSWGKRGKVGYRPRGVILASDQFDWERVLPPQLEWSELIVYEMHVRGFTKSAKIAHAGSYLGVIEKIPHLKELGINCVELMPVHEFDEMEYPRTNPDTGEQLVNYWGYSTVNFFSPMTRYGSTSDAQKAQDEFKTMVRELHRNGIEVILDVVFNHTAEGDQRGRTLSYRGFDDSLYYMLNEDLQYYNFSGCGNTFNANNAVVRNLILDSLRHWVVEMHVDGFRFDLASILGRDENGAPMEFSPLIDDISHDPMLANTKLIAEAWDAGGMYQVGSFFPQYARWGEWNGAYRDTVREFLKGTDGATGEFATRMCGSPDLYSDQRKPYHSVNFITAHDGFTMRDLVSYNDKHNLANGEENWDGDNNNSSWNCGAEGSTNDPTIVALREREIRNMMVALFVAQGTPMLLMGDEYGHTKQGNNNTWCQDNELSWFDWKELEKNQELFTFVKQLIALRKAHPILRRAHFLTEDDVVWHGHSSDDHDWDQESRFIGWTLKSEGMPELYIAFNAHFHHASIDLPEAPLGMSWHYVIDTCMEAKGKASNKIEMPPNSAIVLEACKAKSK